MYRLKMKVKILSSGGQAATKKKKRTSSIEREGKESLKLVWGGLKHGLAKSSICSVHENVVGLP
jgi:hypothetical protein